MALAKVFAEHKIDSVLHFAAFAYVGESVVDPAKYYRNNVANTLNLLEVMREFEVANHRISPSKSYQSLRTIKAYGRKNLV